MSQMVERVEKAIRDNIEAALPLGYAMDYRYAALAAIQAVEKEFRELFEQYGAICDYDAVFDIFRAALKPTPLHPQDILYDMQTDGMERNE